MRPTNAAYSKENSGAVSTRSIDAEASVTIAFIAANWQAVSISERR